MPFLFKTRGQVITDPARYAEREYGGSFDKTRTEDSWKRWETFCTTTQFAEAGGGFVRHCGPTAVTNLVLTACRRRCSVKKQSGASMSFDPEKDRVPAAEEVFLLAAEKGKKRLAYWNMDLFGHFGGTSDILAGTFAGACFSAFDISCHMEPRIALRQEDYLKPLKEGKLLYLELRFHPVYGNHHLAVYGASEMRNASGKRIIFLKTADGWSHSARYLDASRLGPCLFFAFDLSDSWSRT